MTKVAIKPGFHVVRNEDFKIKEVVWSCKLPHIIKETALRLYREGEALSIQAERQLGLDKIDKRMKIGKTIGTHSKEELSDMAADFLKKGGKITECIPCKGDGAPTTRKQGQEISAERKAWAEARGIKVSEGYA